MKVRDGLASGEYRHVKNIDTAKPNDKLGFNMYRWMDEYNCGSVGCIGGWLETKANISVSNENDQFKDLFMPADIGDWDKITPTKAAKAIDNFLNGKEPWDFMRPKEQRKAA